MKKLTTVVSILFLGSGLFAQSPSISVTPDSLSETLFTGKTSTQSINISNNGNSNLNVNISTGFSTTQNYALQFDGVDDYVVSKKNVGISGNQPRTISVWIYVNAFYEGMPVVGWGTLNWVGAICQLVVITDFTNSNNHSIVFRGHWQDITAPVGSVSLNSWLHVSVTYDGSIAKLYLDGILTAESALDLNTVDTKMSLGIELTEAPHDWNRYFNGVIDELSIWNVVRTQAEIQSDMYRSPTGSEPGLVGYWNFDETTGESAFDLTANGNDGILMNGVKRIPGGAPVLWLFAEPYFVTVPAGSFMNIAMKFDATHLTGGNYDANVLVSCNDVIMPEISIPVHLTVIDAPAFSVDSNSINFGEIFRGKTGTCKLKVRNLGSQDLLIFSTAIQPAAYTVTPSFAGIDPGDFEVFTVTFLPQAAGNYVGTLSFNCNDPTLNTCIIPINGRGVEPPVIDVSPDTLHISIASGATGNYPLTIHNTGSSNLNFNVNVSMRGQNNYALQFDGVDDYVISKKNVGITGNQPRTISVWTYVNSFHEGMAIAGWGTLDWEGAICQLYVKSSNQTIYFRGHWQDLSTPDGSVSLNNWYHVSFTFDGSIGKLYLNGILTDELTLDLNTVDTKLNLGILSSDGPNDWNRYFNGVIDELSIWNILRTQAEIQNDMYRSLTGSEPGLVGYWNFNEASVESVFDLTANGNDGILMNGVKRIPGGAPVSPACLTVAPESGICAAGSAVEIMLNIDASDLDPGEYSGLLILSSNDPVNPVVQIPVSLSVTSSTGMVQNSIFPTKFKLGQNYPNPFNSTTAIEFTIPEPGYVSLKVFNIEGQEIATLVNKDLSSGIHKIQWNAENLSSGLYFYRLETKGFFETKKLMLIK